MRMSSPCARWFTIGWLAIAGGWGGGARSEASEPPGRLVWRLEANTVDADFEGWPLGRVLDRIAAKTRWQVFVEPDTTMVVSAKFKELKPGEALRRLLGSLNYMLVPSSTGPSRLYVFRTSMQTATDLVAAPVGDAGEGFQLIPDELVVALKPDARQRIEDLAAKVGAKVIGRLDERGLYRLKFEDEAAARAARVLLSEDADVGGAEANYLVARPDPATSMPGTASSGLNLKPGARPDGSRVVIALVDSAVQADGTRLQGLLLPTVAVAGDSAVPADQLSHGSSMAQTILNRLARAAGPEAETAVRILPVDVYGGGESTTSFEIARGIQAAINNGANVVNLSLGGEQDIPYIRQLVQSGHQGGVMFVAAAGNEPVTTPTYPAAYPEVIAVTAATRDGEIASYANRGGFVDVGASGTSIVPFNGRSYLVVGTSTAAANVSAMAAAMMAASGKSALEVEAMLRQGLALRP